MALNFGDILDAVAAHRRDAPAITSDTGTLNWQEFDARSNALARGLSAKGVKVQDKVGFLLFNSKQYLELLSACFKGRFIHVNLNYRYTASEIEYVLDNSDAAALIYDARLSPIVDGLSDRMRERLILLSDGDDYETLIASEDSTPLHIERSPDDQFFIYTGGTTGMPKGVMWRHDDQAHVLLTGQLGETKTGYNIEDIIARLDEPKTYLTPLIASPLMHGLGLATALTTLCNGGHIVVTDNAGKFDADHHWQLVEQHRIDSIAIVGDAFARPLLESLKHGNYDTSSIKVIGSSGVMWSTALKQELLEYLPQAVMFDSLASSEAMGIGNSVMTASGVAPTAKFKVSEHTRIFDENGKAVEPGSGQSGLLARGGYLPLGYYKDEAKTAETFRIFEGQRYSVPGDICTVDSDGTIILLGRGSQCINSGGEKIFPEEVEQALKEHPDIEDALVFGMADPQWGQAVHAAVRCMHDEADEAELKVYLRVNLAGYKIPKKIIFTQQDLRLANGKPNYANAKALFS